MIDERENIVKLYFVAPREAQHLSDKDKESEL